MPCNGSKNSLKCLAREYASLRIGNGEREHHRHLTPHGSHSLLGRTKRSLGIERIEDCLAQQGIHTTLNQSHHLLLIRLN